MRVFLGRHRRDLSAKCPSHLPTGRPLGYIENPFLGGTRGDKYEGHQGQGSPLCLPDSLPRALCGPSFPGASRAIFEGVAPLWLGPSTRGWAANRQILGWCFLRAAPCGRDCACSAPWHCPARASARRHTTPPQPRVDSSTH